MGTLTSQTPYITYLQKNLPSWMHPRIEQDISISGYIISISVRPFLLIDDEYGKLIKEHHISALLQIVDLEAIKHAKLNDRFMEQVNNYMRSGTFDEYDYDDKGNRIESSKRIRRFTNWVIIENGFPMYMKGVTE